MLQMLQHNVVEPPGKPSRGDPRHTTFTPHSGLTT